MGPEFKRGAVRVCALFFLPILSILFILSKFPLLIFASRSARASDIMRSVYQPAFLNVPRPQRAVGDGSQGRCRPMPAAKNPINELLAPLLARTAAPKSRLHYSPVGDFHHGTKRYSLPRFVFQGAAGGGNPIRLGLFAAIHGDEPETASALCDFMLALDAHPALAQGYELYAYPVCNPSGLEDRTRHSRAGLDLNREFWQGSSQPEVYYLERELGVQQFAGLVALHADDTADGAYAFVRAATLTEHLAKPALLAAGAHLPLASGEIIDGFPASAGLVKQCYDGVLSNPAELKPAPFEIIFETPQREPAAQQIAGAVAALKAILREYRQMLAYGQDL